MNGTEFLKSCTTNVYAIKDISNLSITAYAVEKEPALLKPNELLCQSVVALREHKVLCAVDQQVLFVAGEIGTDATRELEQTGLSPTTTDEGPERQDILRLAIEGSLAFALGPQPNTLHIAPWTWIFSADDQHESTQPSATLVQVEANLADDGTMYISSTLGDSFLRPVSSEVLQDGTPVDVILAPNGHRARLSISMQLDFFAPSTDWTASVSEVLRTEGVVISGSATWLAVELTDIPQRPRITWPRSLCLTVHSNVSRDPSPGELGWRRWFESTRDVGFQNPLVDPNEWTQDEIDCNSVINGAEGHNEQRRRTGNTLMALDSAKESTTSPKYNQYPPEQQASLGGIYPTPPDGSLPVHIYHSTSTSEPFPIPALPELSGRDALSINCQDPSSPEVNRTFRPDSGDSPDGICRLDAAENEVGDADFDYFDMPGDNPIPPGIEMSEVSDAATLDGEGGSAMPGRDASTNASQDQFGHEPAKLDVESQGKRHLQQDGPRNLGMREFGTGKLPETPLSPFGIRERLLPPPIPASAAQPKTQLVGNRHRHSAFGHVDFKEGIDIGAKYVNRDPDGLRAAQVAPAGPDISLPPRRQSHMSTVSYAALGSESAADADSVMTDDSGSSDTTTDSGLPPELPWHHSRGQTAETGPGTPKQFDFLAAMPTDDAPILSAAALLALLQPTASNKHQTRILRPGNHSGLGPQDRILPVQALFHIESSDLLDIAQIVCEQASSVLQPAMAELQSTVREARICTSGAFVRDWISHCLQNVEICSLHKLSMRTEPAVPLPPSTQKSNVTPRFLPRRGLKHHWLDQFRIDPPHVRVQRGSDTYEALPPALNFWNALGLGPTSGAKDVYCVSVVPANEDLVSLARDFTADLGMVYESCKLGRWGEMARLPGQPENLSILGNSAVLVRLDARDSSSTAALRAYERAFQELGQVLSDVGHLDPTRTIVVCVVDPFGQQRSRQAIGACFWALRQTYYDLLSEAQKDVPWSEVALAILPVGAIANSNQLISLDQQQMSAIAMEIYDCCPSQQQAPDLDEATNSLVPMLHGPAIELAVGLPKGLAFQLQPEPPADLLHEGSVMHLAYAPSADDQWLAFFWTDSSGRYQKQLPASLRGRCFADVAAEAWDTTLEFLNSRAVTWRVFILSTEAMDCSIRDCWRSTVTNKPRKQRLHVTLLSMKEETELRLMPINSADMGGGDGAGQLIPTPANTPPGGSVTVSPVASSFQESTAAPPTASERIASLPEPDSDAYLVDTADETWGTLLALDVFPIDPSSPQPVAVGMLFKRGLYATPHVDSAAVSVYWDMRVRPDGGVDEGSLVQVQATLQETLWMYRGLGVLAAAKGMVNGENSPGSRCLPVHFLGAIRAAEAVDGLLI